MQELAIILTGGGTAGHVMPHIALIPELKKMKWDVAYIGTNGIEKELISGSVPFYEIHAGKLRRYFSWKNFVDVFRIITGLFQSLQFMLKNRPKVIFSKGGFVSVPVAIAGWILRIPVISHESDLTPGLANRIIAYFAKEVLYSFPETKKYLHKVAKSTWVGIPVRKSLFLGDRNAGIKMCGFEDTTKPVILFMGGSLGAQRLNQVIESVLPQLTTSYNIIHITGRQKSLPYSSPGYFQIEFIDKGLEHLMAAADIVISRSGANTIFELLALKKPMILVPLQIGSRGDQKQNAASFAANNWATVLDETVLTGSMLLASIESVLASKSQFQNNQLDTTSMQTSEELIIATLDSYINPK